MTIRDDRRRDALEHMADYVLREGLRGASLRPLAAAAGTSDRMLLYYFADKNDLIAATLHHVMARLGGLLGQTLTPAALLPFCDLLPAIWKVVQSPALRPYNQLWLELAALAARGEEPFRAVAGRIADGFRDWMGARLKVDREQDRAPLAAALLTTIEGLVVLDAVGRGDAAAPVLALASGLQPAQKTRRRG
jgi:AcrR family transcriptional regulator